MFSFNKTQPTTSGLSTSTSQPNFFGQSTPAATNAQPAASGGIFSFNKPADQTVNQSTTGGGLFGASQPAAATQANTPGGLFSFANKPATTTTTTPGLSTSSTFGSGLLLNKPTTTTTTSSPFGQPASGTTIGGIFGGFGAKPGVYFKSFLY